MLSIPPLFANNKGGKGDGPLTGPQGVPVALNHPRLDDLLARFQEALQHPDPLCTALEDEHGSDRQSPFRQTIM